MKYAVFTGFLLILVALGIVAPAVVQPQYAYAGVSVNAGGQDAGQWAPSPVRVQILAGSTGGGSVKFTSKVALKHVTFKLSRFSDTTTTALPSPAEIPANTSYTVPISMGVDVHKPAGTYKGTLQLQADGGVRSHVPVVVIVTRANAQTIPQQAASPSADRLTTKNGVTRVNDEVDVGLDSNASNPDQQIREIAAQNHGVILGSVPGLNVYQLRFNVASLDQLNTIRDHIASLAGVSFAVGNYINDDFKAATDPAYPAGSWDGTSSDDNNWGLKYINAPAAWDITTGSSSTRIGVIDHAFFPNHEDLHDNIMPTSGFTGSDIDPKAHGDHVAGIACASGNNGKGMAGVNWQCGLGLYQNPRNSVGIAEQMERAAGDGMRIVNMSFGWGGTGTNGECQPEPGPDVLQARLDEVKAANSVLSRAIISAKSAGKDVLWVFAAGNSCQDVSFISPASLAFNFPANTMTVTAIGKDGHLLEGSNFGMDVSIAAPGEQIYSAMNVDEAGKSNYGMKDGTSMAAPYVTGVAGLVRSAHPDFTAEQVKRCIMNGAVKPVAGYGFKVVDAKNAVTCQAPNNTPCDFSPVANHTCASTDPKVSLSFTNTGDTSACTYNVHADWGDGTTSEHPITGTTQTGAFRYANHTYAHPGNYHINLTGSVTSGGFFCSIGNGVYDFTLQPKPPS